MAEIFISGKKTSGMGFKKFHHLLTSFIQWSEKMNRIGFGTSQAYFHTAHSSNARPTALRFEGKASTQSASGNNASPGILQNALSRLQSLLPKWKLESRNDTPYWEGGTGDGVAVSPDSSESPFWSSDSE